MKLVFQHVNNVQLNYGENNVIEFEVCQTFVHHAANYAAAVSCCKISLLMQFRCFFSVVDFFLLGIEIKLSLRLVLVDAVAILGFC